MARINPVTQENLVRVVGELFLEHASSIVFDPVFQNFQEELGVPQARFLVLGPTGGR
jgi:hypothetical protein